MRTAAGGTLDMTIGAARVSVSGSVDPVMLQATYYQWKSKCSSVQKSNISVVLFIEKTTLMLYIDHVTIT